MRLSSSARIIKNGDSVLIVGSNNPAVLINETASFILNYAARGLSENEIAALLAQSFNVDVDVALQDVHDSLNELIGFGILVSS